MKERKMFIITLVICALLIGFSVHYGLNIAGSPNRYMKTIKSIDNESTGVLKLSAITTGISATITAIPGDTGTPIADHLMTLTTWLFVVMVVLFLEKYSLTLIGKLVFVFIIPIAIAIFGTGIVKYDKKILKKGINIFLIAILIFAAVPTSVKVSDEIKDLYNFSLDNTLAEAENAKEKTDKVTADSDKDENFIFGAISKVTDAVSSKLTEGLDAAETFLNTLTESLAVLVVTSCIIPLITLAIFIWIIKKISGSDLFKEVSKVHGYINKKEDSK